MLPRQEVAGGFRSTSALCSELRRAAMTIKLHLCIWDELRSRKCSGLPCSLSRLHLGIASNNSYVHIRILPVWAKNRVARIKNNTCYPPCPHVLSWCPGAKEPLADRQADRLTDWLTETQTYTHTHAQFVFFGDPKPSLWSRQFWKGNARDRA